LPRAPLLWQEGEVLVGGFVYCGLLGGDFLREGFFLFRNFSVPAGGWFDIRWLCLGVRFEFFRE